MTPQDVIDFFGSIQSAADALGVEYQAVHNWKRNGRVPPVRQWHIQAITAGRLQAIPSTNVDHAADNASGDAA